MQRTSFKPISINKNNMIFYFIIFAFFIGMVYGSILAKSDSDSLIKQIDFITNEYKSMLTKQPLLHIFASAFCSAIAFVALPYLLGFSAIGQVATAIVPIFNGLGMGLSLGFLYINYGLRGVLYSVIIVLPHTIISLFAMVIACRESIKLSNLLLLNFFPKHQISPFTNTMKIYHIKFFVLSIIIVISAIVNVLSVFLFARFFV